MNKQQPTDAPEPDTSGAATHAIAERARQVRARKLALDAFDMNPKAQASFLQTACAGDAQLMLAAQAELAALSGQATPLQTPRIPSSASDAGAVRPRAVSSAGQQSEPKLPSESTQEPATHKPRAHTHKQRIPILAPLLLLVMGTVAALWFNKVQLERLVAKQASSLKQLGQRERQSDSRVQRSHTQSKRERQQAHDQKLRAERALLLARDLIEGAHSAEQLARVRQSITGFEDPYQLPLRQALARALTRLGQADKARTELELVVDRGREISSGDGVPLARAMLDLAHCIPIEEDAEQRERLLREALILGRDVPELRLRAEESLGALFVQLSDWDAAARHYEQAWTLCTQPGPRARLGLALGRVERRLNRTDSAQRSLRSALWAAEASKRVGLQADCLEQLASLHFEAGDKHTANAFEQRSLDLRRLSAKDPFALFEALRLAAQRSRRTFDLKRSIQLEREALDLAEELPATREAQLETLIELAKLTQRLELEDQAGEYWQRALDLDLELGLHGSSATIREQLAVAHARYNRFEWAEDLLLQAHTLRSKQAPHPGSIHERIQCALMLSGAQARNGRLAEARATAADAWAFSKTQLGKAHPLSAACEAQLELLHTFGSEPKTLDSAALAPPIPHADDSPTEAAARTSAQF